MDFTGERLIPDQQRDDDLYHEHIVRYIFAAQFARARRVLDAGCGAGYGAALLAASGALSVLGIDIAQEAVAYAREHYRQPGLAFEVGDVCAPGVQAGSIDLVVALEVIEHLAEPARLAEAAARVLADDGLFVVSTPNPATYPPGNPFHKHEMALPEFSSILSRGFAAQALFEQDVSAAITVRPSAAPGEARDWQVSAAAGRAARQPDYYVAVCARRDEVLQPALAAARSIIYEPPADRWQERIRDLQTMQRLLEEKNTHLAQKDAHIAQVEEELRRQGDWAAGLQRQVLDLRKTWYVRLFGRGR